MRYIKFLFIAFVMLLATAGKVSADNKCLPHLYMFGYAFSFNDSTLYITTVQNVNDVWVRPRNGFVIERETYSNQLQRYFENDGVLNMTCGISYDEKEKKALKKFNKLKERYAKKMKHMRVVTLSEGDFAFTSFVPMQVETSDDNNDKAVKSKKKKSSKKKR